MEAAPSVGRSPSNQCGENSHQSKQNGAGLAAAGRGGFEIEEVEHSEALERAAACNRVVAGLVPAGAACSLGDVQRAAQTGAVKLVGKFGALERKPTNDVSAKAERKSVRVKPMKRSAWRDGCNGSSGGNHDGSLSGIAKCGPHQEGPHLRKSQLPSSHRCERCIRRDRRVRVLR